MALLAVSDSTTKVPDKSKDISNDPRYKEYENKSLEEILDDLCKYGKHRVSYMGDGWYATMELYVNVIGAELAIKSDFYHKTAKNATIQLIIRLNETIGKIANLKD